MSKWTEYLKPEEREQLARLDERAGHVGALDREIAAERDKLRIRANQRMQRARRKS